MTSISAIYLRLPNWIGDVCMSLPGLHVLLNTGAPIVVCARPWAKDLLAGYDLQAFIPMKGHWREDRAAVSAHRKKAGHPHAVGLLLPDSLSSAMVFKFAGLPSAGYRDDGRSPILRWPVRKPLVQLHAVQSWHYLVCAALQRWGLPAHPSSPGSRLELATTPEHRTQAMDTLNRAGLQPGRFILIAPTATGRHKGKNKVWPYFDELTRYLQSLGHIVAMCPPVSEIQQARENAPTALHLAPVGLGAFATLAHLASLVVCNDSGVSHLAAAVNAAQVTLFGVTQRQRTGPWSPQAICLGSARQWPPLTEVRQQVLTLLQ